MEISLKNPFYIKSSNFGRSPNQIQNIMKISIAGGLPVIILECDNLGKDETSGVEDKGDSLSVFNYKPTDRRETQMRKHQELKATDAEIQAKDWKKTVTVSPCFEKLGRR